MSTAEDLSVTATEATVAGSSVALTEAEEDAASFGQQAETNKGKCVLTKESSVKGIKIANEDADDDKDHDEEYAAPMHLHALRTPARLKGAARSRSSSRSRPGSKPGSRRSSPSPTRTKVVGGGELILGGINLSPSQSVESSLDGNGEIPSPHSSLGGDSFDPDILLDKLGFLDLDANATKEDLRELLKKHLSSSKLATLNERMREETMDDVHAFQDLKPAKKSKDEADGDFKISNEKLADIRGILSKRGSKGGLSSSAVMGSALSLLNTLDEGVEEGDDEEDEVILEIPEGIEVMSGGGKRKGRKSNLSTTTIGAASSTDDDDDDAEIEVPTSVMKQLEVSEGKRKLKHYNTSVTQSGGVVNYLEDDEQDGLEADRAAWR